MSGVDFSDRKKAIAWLEKQGAGVRSAIASRAALRVFANIALAPADHMSGIVGAVLRAILTSAVYSSGRTRNVDCITAADRVVAIFAGLPTSAAVITAASAAINSVRIEDSPNAGRSAAAVYDSAASASNNALRSRGSTAALVSIAQEAASADASRTPMACFEYEAWPTGAVPQLIGENHEALLAFFNQDLTTWGFWHDWYLAMWEGRWTDWELAHNVAKIDNDIWEAGAEAVADEIKRIQARFRTSVATPIVRGSDDNPFHLDDEPDLSRETLDFIRERVGGALASALEAGSNNGFDETCYEAIAIQKALESNNPSAVAGLLADVSFSFQTSIGKQYPEDGGLIALRAAAFAGSEEICEEDETARKRCYRLAKLYVDQNATPINQTELTEFTDAISEEADDAVEAILREDAKIIAAGSNAGRFSRARFTNYATTIVQWIDKSRKGHGRAEWLWKTIGKLLDALKDAPLD